MPLILAIIIFTSILSSYQQDYLDLLDNLQNAASFAKLIVVYNSVCVGCFPSKSTDEVRGAYNEQVRGAHTRSEEVGETQSST